MSRDVIRINLTVLCRLRLSCLSAGFLSSPPTIDLSSVFTARSVVFRIDPCSVRDDVMVYYFICDSHGFLTKCCVRILQRLFCPVISVRVTEVSLERFFLHSFRVYISVGLVMFTCFTLNF
jgi:hypothetical protein